MNNERSVLVVRGHQPAGGAPAVLPAQPLVVTGLVLSTHREGAVEAVLDHELWAACLEAVTTVVGATSVDVQLERRRGFWSWLWKRKPPAPIALADYLVRLQTDPDAPDWTSVVWRRGRDVVAAAACEAWYRSGGPAPYHDSYTTSVFLGRASAARLIPVLQVSVARAGGVLERVVEVSSAA
jgi:hypothetical protein